MIREGGIKFSYDYKKSEGVQDFDKEIFPNHFLMLICGKPGSGKTTLLKFLLTHNELMYKKFDFVFIISPSYIEYESLFLPTGNFCKELDFDWIAGKIRRFKSTDTYVNLLFILDDVISDLFKNRQCKEIMDFIFNRRHLLKNGMISIILTSQKYSFVPTCIRSNITVLMTFMLNNIDFDKIKKEVVFDQDTFEAAKSLVFRDDKADKCFLFYRIDNDTYFRNFNRILFNVPAPPTEQNGAVSPNLARKYTNKNK